MSFGADWTCKCGWANLDVRKICRNCSRTRQEVDWQARAEAAEARLEELTRERDEAKAEAIAADADRSATRAGKAIMLRQAQAAEARIKELVELHKEERARGDRIARDWFEFCEDIGVEADTQDAVAYHLNVKLARLEEAKAVLGKAEGKLVELYRSATPHANYDNELGINGHTSGNRFADTDDAVLAVRAFLHQGGSDAR